MKSLNISAVRNRLPRLIEGVEHTRESVMVMRYGTPVAMIVPVLLGKNRQTRHPLRGRTVVLADDFDAPMPELWQALTVAEPSGTYTTVKRLRPKKGAQS
jgi:antitoxin (DNA-binding transcriptional repressor) of toxin-antitoxin stability system